MEGAVEDCCGTVATRRMRFSFLTLFMPQRQFHRLVEMLQLLNLDPLDAKGFKAFRIQVKERLYRFNYVSIPLLVQYDL